MNNLIWSKYYKNLDITICKFKIDNTLKPHYKYNYIQVRGNPNLSNVKTKDDLYSYNYFATWNQFNYLENLRELHRLKLAEIINNILNKIK